MLKKVENINVYIKKKQEENRERNYASDVVTSSMVSGLPRTFTCKPEKQKILGQCKANARIVSN